MASDFGRLFSVYSFIVLLHLRTLLVFSKPRVPCYFIFGDSWVDNGNNNKLATKCKVNYPPYGIDFPKGPTGRFSNGRSSADIIGQLLGFKKFIPPYATATKKDIKTGVNYGSGCAGIRKETGRHLTLYHLGGRKIVVFGLADMGCTPAQIFKFGTEGKPCVESINEAARLFNDKLLSLVTKFNKNNSEARFTFINLASILSPLGGSTAKPQVSCYFIFGDSLVDSGNNNNLATNWKADYSPYGIDFSKGYTGRFTNGRTSADIIGEFLGFDDFIPPYSIATDADFTKGVNYASGGAGIREESGHHNGDRVSLDRQLLNHNSTVSTLSRIKKNTTFLKECIYLVNIGSNDYINNYYMPGKHYNAGHIYSEDQYAEILTQKYSQQLRTLYKLGGRRIAVFGLTHIGCTPFMIKRFSTGGKPCVDWINDANDAFNNRLKALVIELNKDNSDARFTFINTAGILFPQGDLSLRTPPCCKLTGDWACTLNSVPCPVRTLTIFFDALHPTEFSNRGIAMRSYKALLPTDAYPYDIHHLTQV
ncbi:hypothetical protein SSX86_028249 [Deinandra increscens subsp. villosa]|uniref:Uncharacterized protein n=1 Tax=Deinandra increscens subsp. villosa TaxID=3103831 RepID=A0AAP0CDQ2_9ASTR